jgi:ferritin
VTGFINDLVDIAIKEEDHATNNFLQWFVKEQVEEEENAVEILSKIKMIGDAPGILLFLDHELSKRE